MASLSHQCAWVAPIWACMAYGLVGLSRNHQRNLRKKPRPWTNYKGSPRQKITLSWLQVGYSGCPLQNEFQFYLQNFHSNHATLQCQFPVWDVRFVGEQHFVFSDNFREGCQPHHPEAAQQSQGWETNISQDKYRCTHGVWSFHDMTSESNVALGLFPE